MALKCVFLVLITITCFVANTNYASAARELPAAGARLDGSLIDYFNALTELKSRSNEIVLFFVNIETNIGPACCQSIAMITHHCWPAMLTSLGYTAQEGDILRGYCDVSSAPAPTPSLQPLPAFN
ncbi:egg cell-secreted protein 1.4 [Cornus florida]|uniref:egg cell-secreted protein 1.4 n=1 Tax=Cornus florida TaxID=4283 RepID=UPI00289A0A7A|nr:egg cell-secreted protein 1.4 [Cornus florida]